MYPSNQVIMPVLGMNQDSGKIIQWLVKEGQWVKKGEPLLEVETDKAVAEIEAPASGFLSNVKAQPGAEIPVGTVIAVILPSEPAPGSVPTQRPDEQASSITASPLAARMAAENHVDLAQVRPQGGRVEKADVLAYLQTHETPGETSQAAAGAPTRPAASPKARRLAAERGLDLTSIQGSGPEGAVLATDILSITPAPAGPAAPDVILASPTINPEPHPEQVPQEITPGTVWRIMAERITAAWSQTPHFFLMREVDATRLIAWRETARKENGVKITYTDLLVRLVAAALVKHPRLNAAFHADKIHLLPEINIGVATAVEDGLVVPVINKADRLTVSEIAAARSVLVEKARAGRLHPEDIAGGTFTISNLGMYGVDAFLAVLNPPQAVILAVGRIVERAVPVQGQVVIRPTLTLSLSFDHRVVDGARGAQFLDTLVRLIEEPLGLIT